MKLRNFFMAVIAGASLLVGCNKEVDLGPAKLTVNPTAMAFGQAVASQDINLVATRDWAVTGLPDWVALSKESGSAGTEQQNLSVSVTANNGHNRSASITFSIGFERATLTISQEGPEGEVDNGDGSKEKPFTVAGAVAYVNELGADVESPKKVFVKGIISNVETTFEASGTYGNATFDIVDEEGATQTFKVFQTYYLGGKQWTKSDNNPDVKQNDEVIIYGTIYNYKGNTPETTGKGTSFIYMLNGVERGGVDSGDSGEEVPDETLEPASNTNIAGLVAKISKDSDSKNPSSYDGITLSGATVTYVNGGNVYLEDKSGAVLLYLKDSGFTAGDVISGAVSGQGYYYNGLPELTSIGTAYTKTAGTAPVPTEMTLERLLSTYTSQLSRYLVIKGVTVTQAFDGRTAVISQGEKTINVYAGLKEGLTLTKDATGDITVFPTLYKTTKQLSFWDNSHFTGNGGVTPPVEGNDGLSPEKAFTASEAHAWIMANLEDKATTGETKYYVKGTIQRFYQRDNADQNFTNNSYHQASFFITDDGKESTAGEFEAYQIDYLNDATFDPEKDTDVKVGDVVVICGPLKRWGETAETDQKGVAYLYSLNAGSGQGGDGEAVTVKLNNESTWTAGSDDTYGAGFETTASNGVKIGVYKHKSSSTIVTPDQYSVRVYKSAVIVLTAPTGKNITKLSFNASDYNSGANCVDLTYLEGGTGVMAADKTALTIGTFEGSAPKIVLQAAAAQARLVDAIITLDGEGGNGGGEGGDEPKLPEHAGTEADPFTVQDAIYVAKNAEEAKEYYVKAVVGKDVSIKNGAASFELVDGTTSEKLTVVKAKSFKGAAFDGTEPLDWLDEVVLKGKVTEYSTLPALTEASLISWNGKKTFKEPETDLSKVIAAADNSNVYFTGVVSAVSTSSFVVTDGTNNFYVFKPTTMAAIGDQVNVAAVKTTYGGVAETDSGGEVEVVESGKTVVYGNPTDITATFDTYIASHTSKASDYISFTGKLAKSGNYYNVTVEGATNCAGSISYPVATLGLDALDGKIVVFTGYYVGASSKNKYVNLVCTKAVEKTEVVPTKIDIVFDAVPCEGFPTASGTKTGKYTIQGYSFEFSAQTAFYVNTKDKYLMIGKKDSYILLPAIADKKLKSINVKTTSGISASVIADVHSADGTVDFNLQTAALGQSKDITWEIPADKQVVNTSYRIQIETSHNAQFSEIHLVYE